MRSEYNSPPNHERLVERLRQLGEDVPDDATAQHLADVINAGLCDQAVCSRAIVDGKAKCLTFANYWSAVFQRKWVYVPQGERVRPVEELRGVLNV